VLVPYGDNDLFALRAAALAADRPRAAFLAARARPAAARRSWEALVRELEAVLTAAADTGAAITGQVGAGRRLRGAHAAAPQGV
jgi:hypothetical protein